MRTPLLVTVLLGLALATVTPGAGARSQQAIQGQRGTVWVTNRTLNNVVVLDGTTGNVLATIPTGRSTADIAISQQARKAYATNETDNSISVISTESRSVVRTIPVGATPHHIKVSHDGRRVYFGEFGTNKIGVIDTSTDAFQEFTASTNAAARSHSPWPSRDGRTVYVANEIGNEVTALDAATGQIQFSVNPGARPSEVLATPDGRSVYVSVRGENKVKLLDVATRALTREVTVGTQPDTLQLTPDGRTLVVGLRGQPAQMAFVDTSTFTLSATVTIGGAGTTAAHEWLSANGRYLYAGFEGPGAGVAVIEVATKAVVATFPYPGGGRPHGVFYADPAAIAGPAVAVTRGTLSRRGVASVRISCGASTIGFCRGRLVLRSPRATRSFSLAPGASRVVTVRLRGAALAAFRRSGRVRMRGAVEAEDQLGTRRTSAFAFTLRAARRR